MWTDEAVSILRKGWVEGMSANQIAKQIAAYGQGNFSRNAVIGKVHRLGMAGRATPSRPAVRKRRTYAPRPSVPRTPLTTNAAIRAMEQDAARNLPPLAPRFTILTIGPAQCRYGYGDPREDDFCLCGRETQGDAFCADHAKLCYEPSKEREKKRERDLRRLKHALQVAGGAL